MPDAFDDALTLVLAPVAMVAMTIFVCGEMLWDGVKWVARGFKRKEYRICDWD